MLPSPGPLENAAVGTDERAEALFGRCREKNRRKTQSSVLRRVTTPAQVSGQAANRYNRSLNRHVFLASGASQKGYKEEDGGCSLPHAPHPSSSPTGPGLPLWRDKSSTPGDRLHGGCAIYIPAGSTGEPRSLIPRGIELPHP